MCAAYYEVGRMTVEHEQGGKERSKYGSGLLPDLSAFLRNYFGGKGYSVATLKNARQFYLVYSKSIRQTMFSELATDENCQTLIILTHENICVGLRPTISKNLSVFSCVSNQQPA
jgi:hypothetical protein